MTRKVLLLLWCVLAVPMSSQAEGVAMGSDMWTRAFEQWGLFNPHANHCDSSTEVFIAVGGGDTGFCMEKSERTADSWDLARETCASVKKRLPEPGEYKIACRFSPSGLANMTDDNEWASNFSSPGAHASNSYGLVVPVIGNGHCYDGGFMYSVRSDFSNDYTAPFRCVR